MTDDGGEHRDTMMAMVMMMVMVMVMIMIIISMVTVAAVMVGSQEPNVVLAVAIIIAAVS